MKEKLPLEKIVIFWKFLCCSVITLWYSCTVFFFSDIESNSSDLSPGMYNVNNKKDTKVKNKLFTKQRKRERRRRKRCKSKGRIWRHGVCKKRRKRLNRFKTLGNNLIDYHEVIDNHIMQNLGYKTANRKELNDFGELSNSLDDFLTWHTPDIFVHIRDFVFGILYSCSV